MIAIGGFRVIVRGQFSRNVVSFWSAWLLASGPQLIVMLFFIFGSRFECPAISQSSASASSCTFRLKQLPLLLRSFYSHESLPLVNNGVTFILCICLACWITFLNKQGETVPVTIGHSWRASRQPELMNNLEALNAALARAGRR